MEDIQKEGTRKDNCFRRARIRPALLEAVSVIESEKARRVVEEIEKRIHGTGSLPPARVVVSK
jgi:hypothetical protein